MSRKQPNWRPEETKLVLLLYLSHDLKWLASINETTDEIVAMSKKLNDLPLIPKEERGENFRSPGSVKMKLANFKSLDERYGKTSLSNCSKTDRDIWEQYHNNKKALIEECDNISRLLNEEDEFNINEGSAYPSFYEFCKVMIDEAQYYKREAKKQKESDEADLIKVVCSKVVKAANFYLEEKSDYAEADTYVEHGGVNKVPINNNPKRSVKKEEIGPNKQRIGEYVREEMQKLIDRGLIGEEQIDCFISEEWTRRVFHVNHPFFRKISESKPLKDQTRDENGYIRYWKKVHIINGEKYVICKEWYENNRKYFEKWLEQGLDNIELTEGTKLKEIAKFLINEDRRDVYINKSKVIKLFNDVEWIERCIKNMEKRNIIMAFQGSQQQFVVEDFDALYEIADNPFKYICLIEE